VADPDTVNFLISTKGNNTLNINHDINYHTDITQPGELCMRGSIHSDQKCITCGSRFIYSSKKRGLFCPNHPTQRATARFRVYFGRGTQKRFKSFEEAERFLNGIRYETDRGTFDPRDYQKDNPLGFITLAEKWLVIKKQEVKPRSYANLSRYMNSAIATWEHTNIKQIGYGEIEDFLFSQKYTQSKTQKFYLYKT